MSTPHSSGTLFGVGVGPGDPKLLTLAAVETITHADVIAYHQGPRGSSIARGIAEPYFREGHIEEVLTYPVTTGSTEHPGGYRGAIDEFYDQAAARLATHLDAGLHVAVLAEGDPFMYSSFQHMHERLAHRYETVIIPGISSVTACSSTLERPLVEAEETLTVIPGTLPQERLTTLLAQADSAVIMKLGRTFPKVRAALEESGRLDEAWYAERVSQGERQKVTPLHEVDPSQVPYFSLAVVPSRVGAADWMPSAARGASAAAQATELSTDGVDEPGYVEVVGLGPAGAQWRSPEVEAALSRATDVVGYTTYVARVPARAGLVMHDSDNKVESERAEFALDLALRGRRVVVVSSGDPGVFAMATAVLEVAGQERYRSVPVRILPGITAAHAAASRVGAPLGHDYATISLSDRLKPFDVVRERVLAAAAADLVLALYNPASKERTWQVGRLKEDLLTVRDPKTPVVLARAIGDPQGERVLLTCLGDLDPALIDMRTLILIGSSQTRVDERHAGANSVGVRTSSDEATSLQDSASREYVVWTPRRYPETAD
ncbi:precorrin-2 C(20)-methyltransferase [Gephyromycinifex aptenodytis]|uniref:precorrin-2 C(20)-methyltransferase n=1 Tax=Gephyromycinifex aptenodytis TaxID=2716227 RepID=UPI001447C26E|nr:precorrin-2 C(20)-methyltransferase [Gephyromycinifex aptenodytis]